MLKFRVRDIPREGKHQTLSLEPPWFVAQMAGVDGALDQAHGAVDVTLSRTGDEVLARGQARARLSVPCARCLTPAVVEVGSDFATTYVPRGGEAVDDPDVEAYDGEEIDLTSMVREHLLLGIPMSPLCRPDCKGLCPQCGAELNVGPCGCAAPVDPRWDALKALKKPR